MLTEKKVNKKCENKWPLAWSTTQLTMYTPKPASEHGRLHVIMYLWFSISQVYTQRYFCSSHLFTSIHILLTQQQPDSSADFIPWTTVMK